MEYAARKQRKLVTFNDKLDEERNIALLKQRKLALKADTRMQLKALCLELRARKARLERINRVLAHSSGAFDALADEDMFADATDEFGNKYNPEG